MPQLDPFQLQVLGVIYDRGMVRGRDIKRQVKAEKTVDELRTALTTLANQKLVTIQSGSLSLASERGLLDAFIAPLPSGQAMAEIALRG